MHSRSSMHRSSVACRPGGCPDFDPCCVRPCRNIHHHYHILPKPIRHYIHTVEACLEDISQSQDGLDQQNKLSFFQETRHAFGRSALVLSGGGLSWSLPSGARDLKPQLSRERKL